MEEIELHTHSNDTLASLRRQILRRIKPGVHCKLELFVNGELLDNSDDWKLLSQISLRDKMVSIYLLPFSLINILQLQLVSVKLTQMNSNMASSQDSSSDSSTSSPQHPYDGPNLEAENLLPGVIMSMQRNYAHFFCQLAALGSTLEFPPLRDGARALLKLMPADTSTVDKLLYLFTGNNEPENNIDSMFFSASPAEVCSN